MSSTKQTKQRLNELLKYVHRLGQINQEPVFKVSDYQQFKIEEHELSERVGIHRNISDDDGASVWLRIERLKRTPPPQVPVEIAEWVTVSNNPEQSVQVNDVLTKTLPEQDISQLIEAGQVAISDIQDSTPKPQQQPALKEVTLRLDNLPQTKSLVESYINDQWYAWAKHETEKRQTIKIYDAFFSLQQSMEAQGDEQPLELVWGLGVSRWALVENSIDFPLLEKLVEIEIDDKNGAISIRPRKTEPNLVIAPYFALENPGIDALIRYEKKHFSQLPEDMEFSPYVAESFEPILRHAATQLSESGEYWPDVNAVAGDRAPPHMAENLRVSDSWVIFARPRSATPYIQDIERFQQQLEQADEDVIPAPARRVVDELSNKKVARNMGTLFRKEESSSTDDDEESTELYFPKPFNDAQVKIIDRLRHNDGVVVQGPPGTGKTHTIANIISHYLSTGRTVLVTSNGESALTALRNQIPEEVRDLTISLLTNERQGFKQLETAVQLLATIASQTNLEDLSKEAHDHEQQVNTLRQQISAIDSEIHQWGLKQLHRIDKQIIDSDANITAMQLAQNVVRGKERYAWFPDALGTGEEFNLQFTNADVTALRKARRNAGRFIDYIGVTLPDLNELPDATQIAAIHDDLVTVEKLSRFAKIEKLPELRRTVEDAVERAAAVSPKLEDMINAVKAMQENPWLHALFVHWAEYGVGHESTQLLEDMLTPLKELTTTRMHFIKNAVQVPDPGAKRASLLEAVTKLSNGEKPFGLLSIGKGEIKAILDRIEINGEKPASPRQWELVSDYLQFQHDGRRMVMKLNSVGQEYNLPEIRYEFGDSLKALKDFLDTVQNTIELATVAWKQLAEELKYLFPKDLRVDQILTNSKEEKRVLAALANHTSRIDLANQRKRLHKLQKTLGQYKGEVADQLKLMAKKNIGNDNFSTEQIAEQWQSHIQLLKQLHSIQPVLNTINDVVQKIKASGASKWAGKLMHEPVLEEHDPWTPNDWHDAWQWKRQLAYLAEIDQRGHVKQLCEQRGELETKLTRTFTNLVRLKTNIGLHSNLTERVHGALIRFVSAIGKLGAGTGKKRAPRLRHEALRAMQECFDGVPCWIMPTWRISESLPSQFGSFDLVIIDEASQSDIAALPAILRAKKLLVVGDDKQVSPTAAFISEEKIHQLKQNYLAGQPFADLLIPGVSLYDLASAVYPTQRIMLTEHFRCVEPIIRFSMQFYSDSLIPLRVPKASEKIDPPLVDVYVHNGQRDENEGTNTAEVDAIVSEIKQIVNDPKFSGRSIGVISLIGSEQAAKIQEALLQEVGEDVYQKFDIGCGDSATFQGKEKDIIFLSLVVGPKQGAPLNKREFEQRFNVALSRARDRMYLYRSIKETDLKHGNDLRLRTIRYFSNPMPPRPQVDNPLELCETDFERDVYKRLFDLGYAVSPKVKVGPFEIDMVIEGGRDQRLAVELDGDKPQSIEHWADCLSQQRTLERVGWPFWRCWGSSYTLDPDACIADLVATMTSLGIEPIGGQIHSNIYTDYREYRGSMQGRDKGLDE
ncbi:MAG: AAA domain-containing protein [Gammaproteobacteria bacterium]|jgi:hypothetical protein